MKKLKYAYITMFLLNFSVHIREILSVSINDTSLGYNPEEMLTRIFNIENSGTPRQSGYGFSFEDDQNTNALDNQNGYGYMNFNDETNQINTQNSDTIREQLNTQNTGPVVFQDQYQSQYQPLDINLNTNRPQYQHLNIDPQKKKRRRRKKPRLQQLPGSGYGLQYPVPNNQGHIGQNLYGLHPEPLQRPYYRPQIPANAQSLAESALTAITRALGSIAVYDDFQCVPRLLCEVAGGKTSSGGSQSSVLTTILNLQPLITLLAAYNGVSSSPLFVFGRAVFLGMTSKGNSGVCRYGYPLCPTDPEKLVEYLNNHNGGFFRFFSGAPLPPSQPGFNGQPGLEQFYSQLSNIPGRPQNYGFQQPDDVISGQYGMLQSNYGGHRPNLYNRLESDNQKYGLNYPYDNNGVSYKSKDNKIEKRIQNNPNVVLVNKYQENNLKWTFPESVSDLQEASTDNRIGREIRFPKESKANILTIGEKKEASNFFPGSQSNRKYVEYYNYPPLTEIKDFVPNGSGLKFDDESGYYIENSDFNGNTEEGRAEVVYVIRGNGDPNNPEVVKLRPGQKDLFN